MAKKTFNASTWKNMLAFSEPFFKRGEKVIVGFSGGADSVCLLHFLRHLSQKKHFEVMALHVNHGLRGAAATADEKFCKKMAKELDVVFFSKKKAVRALAKKLDLSIEHAARKARYEAFAELAKKTGAAKIALGHHLDDQAETVLLNLLRGTRVEGLCGIPRRRPLNSKVEIVRPLLCITRAEVEEYIKENNLSFVTDQTNQEDIYTRNWVRHEVLPLLESKQPKIRQHLAGMAAQLAEKLK
ncbi:MAG: tRNA lysidine(34) synthetase TilS [Elusimicrobiaceae bacterium]|nr:tRNA lysidine(34) synthetase TilS [Elusimicrobiaceae bacterium]